MEEKADSGIAFDESGDFLGVSLSARDYVYVPGWPSLEKFLKDDLSITSHRALESFRGFYNHYLKRFPVHYFTGQTIPGIEFALFFPVRLLNDKRKSAYYLVAIGDDNRRVVLYQRNMPNQMRSRMNFYYQVKKWKEAGPPDESYRTNIQDLIGVCENAEELIGKRKKVLPSYLKKLEHRLKKQNLSVYFEGKWDRIQKFLEERDRHFLYQITGRMKSDHVDFEVAKTAATVAKENLHIYNWIMAGDSAVAVRNRMQAVTAFPWLGQALAEKEANGVQKKRWEYNSADKYMPLDKVTAMYRACEKAIDAGERLIPVIQDVLIEHGGPEDVSQSVIRKTLGLRLRRDLREPQKLAAVLRDIDNHLPSMEIKEGDLEVLHDVQKEGERGFRYLNTCFAEVLSHAPEEVRKAMMDPRKIALTGRDISNTPDYIQQVYAKLVLPYFAHEAHRRGLGGIGLTAESYLKGAMRDVSLDQHDPAFENLPPYLRPFGNMRVHNLIKLSVAWHNDLKQYSGRMRGVEVPMDATWPTFVRRIVAPNGVEITARNSKAALQLEHDMMGHCINFYAAHCLGTVDTPGEPKKYSHIFHLAAQGNSKIQGTFEIDELFGARGPRKVSAGGMDGFRIKKDTWNVPEADSPLWTAAHWLVDSINDGSLKVEWDKIDKAREGVSHEAVKVQAGFDPTVWADCEEAYRIFQPFLPERYRHYSYEQWIEKMGFARDADVLFREGADLSLLHLNRLEYTPGG